MREDAETYPFWIDRQPETGSWRMGLCAAFVEDLPAEPVGLDLASVGTRLRRGDTLGFLHTPERTHDLRAPCSLEVMAVNAAALADARLAGASSYGRGWFLEVRLETQPD